MMCFVFVSFVLWGGGGGGGGGIVFVIGFVICLIFSTPSFIKVNLLRINNCMQKRTSSSSEP